MVVQKNAYLFNGEGNFYGGRWTIAEVQGLEFRWLHLHLPNSIENPEQLHTILPFLNLRDIHYLTNHGYFCITSDNSLFCRVNLSDSPSSHFAFRFAARLTHNSLITVSSEEFPRLGFLAKEELPRPHIPTHIPTEEIAILIEEDNPVPISISYLFVHLLDHYLVRYNRQLVFELQRQLSGVTGERALKKPMMDKIHMKVERAHQVIGFSESVLTRVKEECSCKLWFCKGDIAAIEDLIGQLGMLKGDVRIIAKRATTIQSSHDSWRSSRRSYISVMTLIVAVLSLVLSAFGMNVGGIPWTGQSNPMGFRNVMLLCLSSFVLLLFLLFCWRKVKVGPDD